jgi:hypothetical protein
MKHALRTGEAIDVEYRVLSVDGDWRWMRSRGSPRFGPSGEIMRWYGSVEDIHDQKLHPKDATDESRDASLDDQETLARGPIGSETLQHSVEDQATPDRQGRSSRPG